MKEETRLGRAWAATDRDAEVPRPHYYPMYTRDSCDERFIHAQSGVRRGQQVRHLSETSMIDSAPSCAMQHAFHVTSTMASWMIDTLGHLTIARDTGRSRDDIGWAKASRDESIDAWRS